jgi:hypothetical protein
LEFGKGCPCSINIFILNLITENHWEFNKEIQSVFTDYSKAFDKIDRHILWQILTKKAAQYIS